MQRHALRTSGQVWIDAQPPRVVGLETGSVQQHPVKVMTSFKTIEDEIPAPVPPPLGICSLKSATCSVIASSLPNTSETCAEESNPAAAAAAATTTTTTTTTAVPVLPEVEPVTSASNAEVRNLTLDELYAQCEQLAESLTNPEKAEVNGPVSATSSEDEEPEENDSEMDMISEQVSVSCDSWRDVRHLTIHEEEETGTGCSTPQHHLHEYYTPEYIEVEEPEEPVPTQDSCLQVTETNSIQSNPIQSNPIKHPISSHNSTDRT